MRLSTCLFAVASLATALPAATLAQDGRPPRVEVPPPPSDVPPPPPRAEPPPLPRAEPRPPPREYRSPYPRVPGPVPRHAPRHFHTRPRWWGWGWGWYPLYPVYPVPPPPAYPPGHAAPTQATPREQDRIYTRFSVYGAGRHDGYVAGLTFRLDSRFVGLDADVSALARESITGPLRDDESDPATLASAHVTWTLFSDRSFRLRAETGFSLLALPDSEVVIDQPWRGKTLVGPDVGISGQIGMVGPVGIEGYARITPFPERIVDTFVGLNVHGGPVGVSAGWRWVDIAGDGVDAPETFFRGPQVGLVLAF